MKEEPAIPQNWERAWGAPLVLVIPIWAAAMGLAPHAGMGLGLWPAIASGRMIHPLQRCGIAAIQLVYWDQLQELDLARGGMVHKRNFTGSIGLECLSGQTIHREPIGGVGFETFDGVRNCGAYGRGGLGPLAGLVGRVGPGLDGNRYLGAGGGSHGERPIWVACRGCSWGSGPCFCIRAGFCVAR